MADYELLWASFGDRNNILGELPVTSLEYSDILNAPGEITGTVHLNPYPDHPTLFTQDNFREADTVLYVLRDGVTMWGGILWGWRANVNNDTVDFTGEGWHSYIRRRTISQTVISEGFDQAEIAERILQNTINTADPLDIQFNIDETGVDRDRTYYWWEGKNAGEAIEQLAAVENGFDFYWSTTRNPATGDFVVTFNLLYPTTGRATNHVFELGTNVSFVNYSSDGKGITTRWLGFGSGQGAGVLYSTAYDPGAFGFEGGTRSYQLFDDVASWPDVVNQTTLDEHVGRRLTQSTTPARLIVLNHYPNTEPQLGAYTIGDQCLVTASRGFVQIDRELHRIVERRVVVADNGGESVQLTLSPIGLFG